MGSVLGSHLSLLHTQRPHGCWPHAGEMSGQVVHSGSELVWVRVVVSWTAHFRGPIELGCALVSLNLTCSLRRLGLGKPVRVWEKELFLEGGVGLCGCEEEALLGLHCPGPGPRAGGCLGCPSGVLSQAWGSSV